jgi:phosphoglycolate phosphatase-like HAD superfamily hydrolase
VIGGVRIGSVPLADKRLVLWDIDHTLIDTGGVGREIYQEAFEQVTERPMKRQADISGRTEPDIFQDTLALHDLEPSEESLERFADAMAAGYSAKMPLMRQRGHGLPGAAEALAALDQVPRHRPIGTHRQLQARGHHQAGHVRPGCPHRLRRRRLRVR